MSWDNDFAALFTSNAKAGNILQIATMLGPTSCKIGNLILSGPDLLIADHLLHSVCTGVSMTAPAGGGPCTDKSTYISALKAGDLVVITQISDDKFIVLERVVST
ncbi:MAG: hypothetical protein KBS66_07415 [Eubacterium sp.]|nr:hypothetical protein [Candidatus Colimonas fimequi]